MHNLPTEIIPVLRTFTGEFTEPTWVWAQILAVMAWHAF